jgi:hypothetical protein
VRGLLGARAWLACVRTHEKHLRFLAEAYVSIRQPTPAYVCAAHAKHLRLLAEV